MGQGGHNRLSDEELQNIVDAVKRHGSQRAAVEELGLSKSTIGHHMVQAAKRGMLGYKPVLPGFEVSRITTKHDKHGEFAGENIVQTPERTEKFVMPEGNTLKRVSAYVDADNNVIGKWIITKEANEDPAVALAAIKEGLSELRGISVPAPAPEFVDSDWMTMYPLPDIHMGVHAWERQTGRNWDLKIAKETIGATARTLIGSAVPSETCLILNMGDYYHVDDNKNATPTSNHRLDADNRYYKILKTGAWMMRDIIEMAKLKHRHVIVRNLPGNHDPNATPALTLGLQFAFENDPRVTIIDDPGKYFFHRFGKVLIGAHHGDDRKSPENKVLVMAHAARREWGETEYSYFYFGHIHHETKKEIMGTPVESFNTPSGKDGYATDNGFLSGQSLQAIHFHKDRGEGGRNKFNIFPAPTLSFPVAA